MTYSTNDFTLPKYAFGAAALILFLTAPLARADQLVYWTNFGGNAIMKGDVTTSTNTTVDSPAPPAGVIGQPDSLLFDTKGNIVYTVFTRNVGGGAGTGQVRLFNGTTDTMVATGFSDELVDIALDPSGASVLVSDRNAAGGEIGNIDRVNLTTGIVTVLTAGVNTVDGLAYDTKTGGLFALMTSGGGQKLVQINPTTGAIINAGDPNFNGPFLDGLTYDPVSDRFYAASGSCLQTFNANSATLAAGSCVGAFSSIDGVESDAAGHILVADVGAGKIGEYTLTGGLSSYILTAPGLDDIAPVAGLGAPTPEPNSVILLGGMVALIFWRFRKRLAS